MSITHQDENAFMRISAAIEDNELAALKSELDNTPLTGSPHVFIEKATDLSRLDMLDYFHGLGWSFNHKVIFNLLIDYTRAKNTEIVLNLLSKGANPPPAYLESMAKVAIKHGECRLVSVILDLLQDDNIAEQLILASFPEEFQSIFKPNHEMIEIIVSSMTRPITAAAARENIVRELPNLDLSIETIARALNEYEAISFSQSQASMEQYVSRRNASRQLKVTS